MAILMNGWILPTDGVASGRSIQCACDHILGQATEVPETIWLVFSMELIATSNISEVGSENKVCFVASFTIYKVFLSSEKIT